MDLRWTWLFLDTPESQAEAWEFWTAVTGSTLSERRGETGQFATLLPPVGDPWIKVQRVGDGGGVHLDLDSSDRAAALGDALAAGATQVTRYHDVEVMASPGGLTFCLTVEEPGQWVRGDVTMLDQVCIDIPPHLWESEVAFWSELTGLEPVGGRSPAYARLLPPPGRPMRMLLQRLDSHAERVTAHPDFASSDRSADTATHVALGAVELQSYEAWTVLRAPGGQVYCLTDRDPATGELR